MSRRYLDTALNPRERAKALLAEMSLDEKMAQVGCIFPFGETYKDLDGISESTKFGIGQISTLEMRQIESLEAALHCMAAGLDVELPSVAGYGEGLKALFESGEGVDASSINLPACQDEFIRRASALGKPLIGVHFDGRPISSAEYVTVECTVENVGTVAGDEVVQLYLRDKFASMTRPVKELAGFSHIHLKAGERKRIRFDVAASQLAFLDESMCRKVENGRVLVEIGASSEDIRLRGEYRMSADAWIDGRRRAFYARTSV